MSAAAGSAFAALALASLYLGLRARRGAPWLAAAGAAFALSAELQPVFAIGAAALLLPMRWSWWRDRSHGFRELLTLGGAFAAAAAVCWLLHEPGLQGWSLQQGRLGSNLYALYLAPPQLSRYFPFLEPVRPSPALPGTEGLPGGLLVVFPFGWLALAAPLAVWGRRAGTGPGAFLNAVGVFHLALAAALVVGRPPSGSDLIILAPSLAVLGWAGWTGLKRWVRRGMWVSPLAAVLAGASLLAGLVLGASRVDGLDGRKPEWYHRMAHAFDRPTAVLERFVGAGGPLDLIVRLPSAPLAVAEPLVQTGWPPLSDRLLVRPVGGDRIQFGFVHGAEAPEWVPSVAVDLEAAHRLRVEMGSLFPPRDDPFLDRLGPGEADLLVRRLRIAIDGRTLVEERRQFYESSPGSMRIGGGAFTGRVYGARWGGWERAPGAAAAFGTLRLKLAFPLQPPQGGLPLISIGRPRRGGVLFARFSGPSRIRLGYDQWGAGLAESGDFPIEPGSIHILRIRLPALLAPGGTPGARAVASSLLVQCDNGPSWLVRIPAPPPARGPVYLGRNAVDASSCRADFPGTIIAAEPEGPARDLGPVPAGAVRFRLEWPSGRQGRREPLVVTGAPGRADLLSVEYMPDGRVRFALDHWGRSFLESPPITTDFRRMHDLDISVPVLDVAPPGSSGREFRGQVRVVLDGVAVWESVAPFYRADASELALAENRIGGSCDPEFTGGVAAVVLGRPSGG